MRLNHPETTSPSLGHGKPVFHKTGPGAKKVGDCCWTSKWSHLEKGLQEGRGENLEETWKSSDNLSKSLVSHPAGVPFCHSSGS